MLLLVTCCGIRWRIEDPRRHSSHAEQQLLAAKMRANTSHGVPKNSAGVENPGVRSSPAPLRGGVLFDANLCEFREKMAPVANAAPLLDGYGPIRP